MRNKLVRVPGIPGKSPPGVSTAKVAGNPVDGIVLGTRGAGDAASEEEEGSEPSV
jgi:hypothetical protein